MKAAVDVAVAVAVVVVVNGTKLQGHPFVRSIDRWQQIFHSVYVYFLCVGESYKVHNSFRRNELLPSFRWTLNPLRSDISKILIKKAGNWMRNVRHWKSFREKLFQKIGLEINFLKKHKRDFKKPWTKFGLDWSQNYYFSKVNHQFDPILHSSYPSILVPRMQYATSNRNDIFDNVFTMEAWKLISFGCIITFCYLQEITFLDNSDVPAKLYTSVTRLGDDFWKFLATNFIIKVAQMFLVKLVRLIFRQLLENLGYFLFHHLVTLLYTYNHNIYVFHSNDVAYLGT